MSIILGIIVYLSIASILYVYEMKQWYIHDAVCENGCGGHWCDYKKNMRKKLPSFDVQELGDRETFICPPLRALCWPIYYPIYLLLAGIAYYVETLKKYAFESSNKQIDSYVEYLRNEQEIKHILKTL